MPDSIPGTGTVPIRPRGLQPGMREMSSEAIAGRGRKGCDGGIPEPAGAQRVM